MNALADASLEEIGGGNTWNTETQLSFNGHSSFENPRKETATSRVDLFTSGAYDNFDTITSVLPDHAPPPKFVTTANKYRLSVASLDLDELNKYCFKRKGRAHNMFCLKKNCNVKHQGATFVMPFAPDFVAKDKVFGKTLTA